MRTTSNLTKSMLKGATLVLIIMASLGSSFAQGSVKAQSFDKNNTLGQMMTWTSTEIMPRPNYDNSLILMEEKHTNISVSSNLFEDKSLEKTAIKNAKSVYENLCDYLIWASGLRIPFKNNYESPDQINSNEQSRTTEEFLIAAAQLQVSESSPKSENEVTSDCNNETSFENFLINAAGYYNHEEKNDNLNSSATSLELFLINASKLTKEIQVFKNELAGPSISPEELDLEQFLIKAANFQEAIADVK
jgi:hypothetical protein